jgi:hypothetical protein
VRTLKMTFLVLAMTGAARAAQANWFSDESPPANAKPLSEIIKSLEDKGYPIWFAAGAT